MEALSPVELPKTQRRQQHTLLVGSPLPPSPPPPNTPRETPRWAWHLHPSPTPSRWEHPPGSSQRRARFLTPRSKRLRKGFSARVCASQGLQSTHRRTSFLPPHLQAVAPPKRCQAFTFTSPLASHSPLKDGTSRNCLFHYILERMRLREAK